MGFISFNSSQRFIVSEQFKGGKNSRKYGFTQNTKAHFSTYSVRHGDIAVVQYGILSLVPSLVDQTTPSTVLYVLHHQHTEGGSGHSGRAFVTDAGM